MAGGVPNSLLYFADSGVDAVGYIISSVYNYVSPFLISGLAKANVNMQTAKKGEQFSVTRISDPLGIDINPTNMKVDGFAYQVVETRHSVPHNIISVIPLSTSSMAVISPLASTFGSQYSDVNSSMLESEKMARAISAHVTATARSSDKFMFKDIFGTTYVKRSNGTFGGTITTTTETYLNCNDKPDKAMSTNFLIGDPVGNAVQSLGEMASLYHVNSTTGKHSSADSGQLPYVFLPSVLFSELALHYNLVSQGGNRLNSDRSDGTFSGANTAYMTAAGTTFVSIPYTWFYTKSGDANNSYLSCMVVPDGLSFYSPKMSNSITEMSSGFSGIPGLSGISSMNSYQLSQFLVASGIAPPSQEMNVDEKYANSARYADPVLEGIKRTIVARYPDPYGTGYNGYYDPLCFAVWAYRMPPATNETSLGTAFSVSKFAGAIRANPYYLTRFTMDPTKILGSPPAYSNPLTTTLSALNSMPKESFMQFVSTNPQVVNNDLAASSTFFNGNAADDHSLQEEITHRMEGKEWMNELNRSNSVSVGDFSSSKQISSSSAGGKMPSATDNDISNIKNKLNDK